MLRPFVLHGNDQAGGYVRYSDGAVGCVHVLPACARCTVHINTQIRVTDLDVHLARQQSV